MTTLAELIVSSVMAFKSCIKSGNKEWEQKHYDKIEEYQKQLPHGAGIDGNNVIDIDKTNDKKLVIHTEFHHMTEHGFYDGWTEHTITIIPQFIGFDIKVSGTNRSFIKEYLIDVFYDITMED